MDWPVISDLMLITNKSPIFQKVVKFQHFNTVNTAILEMWR